MTEKSKPTDPTDTGEYRSIAILDQVMATIEPSIWVRDATIDNIANGGDVFKANIYIVDSAWITGTEYGPQFQHRYEVEFYEDASLRAKIAVTFGLLFDLYDGDSELQDEYFEFDANTSGQTELFRRSSLYKHSWPRLREFVEHALASITWHPVQLPEHFEPTSTPISSAYMQGLMY